MGDPFWKDGFGKMLEAEHVPFGDIEALRQKLATRRFAAFFVEPIQGESGIRIPPPNYLAAAKALCEEYGSLLVLDEVQTGVGRTGTFLAAHPHGVEADMVLLAKALSGGLIPCSAVLMTEPIYDAVYSSIQKSIVHTSTFSENALSMRAALATLDVLDQENLAPRASELGDYLRSRLREELLSFEMVREIRGVGLLNGIEFQPPRQLRLRAAFETFRHLHPALFGQVVVMRLFRQHNILTQICGNAFMVLKAAPPLMIDRQHVDKFVAALRATMEEAHTSTAFWTEPLGLARRILGF
jgi:ornithine--oxo-acid transaminase